MAPRGVHEYMLRVPCGTWTYAMCTLRLFHSCGLLHLQDRKMAEPKKQPHFIDWLVKSEANVYGKLLWMQALESLAWVLMGPSGGPGAACPDLTIARITLLASTFFTALAAFEIFDILLSKALNLPPRQLRIHPLRKQKEHKQQPYVNTQLRQINTPGSFNHHTLKSIQKPTGETRWVSMLRRTSPLNSPCCGRASSATAEAERRGQNMDK
ncbi:hypothetical protein EYF80_045516 [Liparis tanakae]|uniref:Uncharacterized protein n=1 Tax=Liparis tanakae TaxID=230148 RepID=A0A4Z2FTE6_9TELE|nr:hypothetical protein EYF80_045516 [Liparis tanakae]